MLAPIQGNRGPTYLERQLGLSYGGGVYFEGSRVDPIKQKAFLFVGLGGTGADALLRIKNQVRARMNLPRDTNGVIIADAPANVGFLEIDSDDTTKLKTYGQVGFDPQEMDFQSIGVNNLASVIEQVLNHERTNNPEMAWYDDGVNAIAGRNGACGVRQIGRLLLFKNISQVRTKIQTVIRNVAGRTNSLYIFVVTGIGGGTGSGTFLDMAYLLRHIAANDCQVNNVNLMGYIVTPDLNLKNGAKEENLYCNGFASLKELDYWMSSEEHLQPFVQNYGSGCIVNMTAQPFDFCHIISGQDFNNYEIGYDEALSAIAENLFAYISNDMGISAAGNVTFDQMYVNIGFQIKASEKPFPASYRYLSIGADMRRIPYAEIAALLGARVFQKLKDSLIDQEPSPEQFAAEQKALGLTDDAFRSFATKNVAVNPLNGRIAGKNRYKWEDIWNKTGNNVPAKRVHDWLALSQPAIYKQCANLAADREGVWKNAFGPYIGDGRRGPCYVARLLYSNNNYSLIQTMERARIHYAELTIQCAERAVVFKKEMEDSYTDGSTAGFGRKGDAVIDYLNKLNCYAENEIEWFVCRDLEAAMGKLLERLQLYYDKLFRPLKDTLEELYLVFDSNYKRLVAIENQSADAPDPKQLIMPFAFERANKGILAKQVNKAADGFATEVRNTMKLWVGLDITTVDDETPQRTDISGVISRYIEDSFKEQMSTSIEALLTTQMSPGQIPNQVYDRMFADLNADAIPMFLASTAYGKAVASEFAFLCIPSTCSNILLRAQNTLVNNASTYGHVSVKQSQEQDKIYWAKIISGLPLYAFARMEQMETCYEKMMKVSETRAGVHLHYDWYERLPSPVPERAWSAGYHCEHTFNQNREARANYDICLKEGILTCASTSKGRLMQLRVAKQAPDLTALYGNLNQRLASIDQIRDQCWAAGDVEWFHALGELYMKTGTIEEQITKNARENVLRFYSKCQILKEQAAYLKSIRDTRRELEVVKYYVYARAAELFFIDNVTKIMLRRSPLDYAPVMVYDRNQPKPHEDYHMYQKLLEIFDRDWRQNLDLQWQRVIRECADDQAKREKLFTRLDARIALCQKEMTVIDQEINSVPVNLQEKLYRIRQYFQYCMDACISCKALFGCGGDENGEDMSLV